MKKEKASIIAFLILFFIILFSNPESNVVAKPNTIVVPVDYSTIQSAINAAQTGDTIFIKQGTYYETLKITKTLSIVGENQNTVIDGNKNGPVILIEQTTANITNLTIQNGIDTALPYFMLNGHVGIHLLHASNCSISNNIIQNNGYGIWAYESSDNAITSNKIIGNNIAIVVEQSSQRNSITRNTIENNKLKTSQSIPLGLLVRRSNKNTVKYNTIQENMYGVLLEGSSSNIFTQNNVQNNNHYNMKITNYQDYDASSDVIRGAQSTNNEVHHNYWSDYNGVDYNSDGIGDSPYEIMDNNWDSFPQMELVIIEEPQKDVTAPSIVLTSPLNKTYYTNIVSLKFAINETVSVIAYILDNKPMVSVTQNPTLTLSGLSEGSHSIAVYSQDINGNGATSETVHFTIQTFPTTWILILVAIILCIAALTIVTQVQKNRTTNTCQQRT